MRKNRKPAITTRRLLGSLSLATALFIGLPASAQTYLWSDHADVGVNYENGTWDLHVHAANLGELEPDEAVFGVDIVAALNAVPPGAQWSFLGSAGASVWILPQIENPALLYLGIGTEELETGIFVNDQVTLSLVGVNGPGNFALYQIDMFGNPNVLMNAAGGAPNALTLTAGSQLHANWAFTAPGTYEVSFSAAGALVGGGMTGSGPVAYTFEVAPIPEPGAAAVLGLGLAALALARSRRHETP